MNIEKYIKKILLWTYMFEWSKTIKIIIYKINVFIFPKLLFIFSKTQYKNKYNL